MTLVGHGGFGGRPNVGGCWWYGHWPVGVIVEDGTVEGVVMLH